MAGPDQPPAVPDNSTPPSTPPADSAPPPPPPPDSTPPPPPADSTPPLAFGRQKSTKSDNPTDNVVQRTRAWTGLWVVIGGDAVIAAAAIWGVVKTASSTAAGSAVVAILTSAFTAIGTMTTAYFGIRSAANTAEHFRPLTGPPSGGGDGSTGT